MRLQSTMALQEEERQDMAYPLDPNSYKILQKIGCGVSATVYKAICLPMNSKVVAIKAIDLERSRANLDDVRKEAKAMALLSHPNILKAHCSFTVGHRLWVVMPFMSAGSLQSIITSSFPSGLNESCIAIVLKETLNALLYLHDQGHLHRDIKAGNILVDSDGSVKLADFGVSASIYEPNSSQTSSTLFSSSNLRFNDLAGTPYWMAPEVIHSHVGYSFKADIWSFGITALELAHGRPPLSHLPPWKSLFMRITNRLRLSDYEKCRNDKTKKFSKCFKDMIGCCLFLDPSRRPAAEKLLKHPFFKNSRSVDFLVKSVLQGLPTIEERYNQSSPSCNSVQAAVDDDSDEDTEESSVGSVEKHRRISGWNFNDQVLDSNPVFGNQNKEHNVNQVKFHGNDIFQANANVELEEKEIDAANPPLSLTPFYLLDDIDGNDNANEIEYKDGEREKLDMELGMGTTDEAGIYMGTYKNVENTISNVEDQEESESSPESKNGEASMVAAAPLVPLLRVIMDSLEDERQVLSHLIGNISGGHVEIKQEDKLQQTITQLKLQLEQEKKRSSDLQMELDSLKQNAISKIEDVSQSTYGV